MIDINSYIVEKLRINNDLKFGKTKEKIFIHMMGCMGFKGFEEKHIKENHNFTKSIYKWIDDNNIGQYPKAYTNKDHAEEENISSEYLEQYVDDPQLITNITDYLFDSNEKPIAETDSMDVYLIKLNGSFIPKDMQSDKEGLFIVHKIRINFSVLFIKDDNN